MIDRHKRHRICTSKTAPSQRFNTEAVGRQSRSLPHSQPPAKAAAALNSHAAGINRFAIKRPFAAGMIMYGAVHKSTRGERVYAQGEAALNRFATASF
jgi:hypothetical protein